MRPYQLKYVENLRQISSLRDILAVPREDYKVWLDIQLQHRQRLMELKKENMALLETNLFPVLDGLHAAGAEEVHALEEFADQLMDWSTNLDSGLYVKIHDAFLSLARVRKDRDGIIRELYKLGMGLYYLNRMLEGLETPYIRPFRFRGEMVFTEAGSYLKFFREIHNEETQGYIIRALANIAISSTDIRRKVAVSARVLEIVQDDYYRSAAPSLPWDVFLRRTNQQMSSNRAILSKGNLSPRELSSVLEACFEVFKPEEQNDDPNIRWLWPYYEMEYSCGFADLSTTMDRLERLILRSPEDQHDMSGLYGNVQLPVYYGILMRDNPKMNGRARRLSFLKRAYEKMLRVILSHPAEQVDDFFAYLIRLVVDGYYEAEGGRPFSEVIVLLMQRFSGELYFRSLQTGDIMKLLCDALLTEDPHYFDDIDFIASLTGFEERREKVLAFAGDCAIYHDVGLMQMNVSRLIQSRELLDNEYQMAALHTVLGRKNLARCPSTAIYADTACGHHRWYDGADGYPEEYLREKSPYRMMTDTSAAAAFLVERYDENEEELMDQIVSGAHRQFSPMVAALFSDETIRRKTAKILGNPEPYYQKLYESLSE